jgi:leucyl/phenylalanyl-tRNA--protein transferase
MAAAYTHLHRLGWAHSFEAWHDDELAGGLYGVAIGRVFFGESMFTRIADASKVAFVESCRFLDRHGFALIDCQMPTGHLQRFGAHEIPRADFLDELATLVEPPGTPGSWTELFSRSRRDPDSGLAPTERQADAGP